MLMDDSDCEQSASEGSEGSDIFYDVHGNKYYLLDDSPPPRRQPQPCYIDKLPVELLREILKMIACPAFEKRTLPYRVSKAWSTLVFDIPDFWQEIWLTAEHYDHALKWAGLTKTLLLTLHIELPEETAFTYSLHEISAMYATACELAPRCQTLVLAGGSELSSWFLTTKRNNVHVYSLFNKLERLRFYHLLALYDDTEEDEFPQWNFAPRFERLLEISTLRVLALPMLLRGATLPALSITSLSYDAGPGRHGDLSLTRFVEMLSSLSLLERLHLQGDGWDWPEAEFTALAQFGLDHLQTLQLTSLGFDYPPSAVTLFLNALYAPELRHLHVIGWTASSTKYAVNHLQDVSFRSPKLDILFLDNIYFAPESNDADNFFSKFSSVTRLIVFALGRGWRDEPRDYPYRQPPLGDMDFQRDGDPILRRFSEADISQRLPKLALLQILEPYASVHDIRAFLDARNPPLTLPRLEYFRLSSEEGSLNNVQADEIFRKLQTPARLLRLDSFLKAYYHALAPERLRFSAEQRNWVDACLCLNGDSSFDPNDTVEEFANNSLPVGIYRTLVSSRFREDDEVREDYEE